MASNVQLQPRALRHVAVASAVAGIGIVLLRPPAPSWVVGLAGGVFLLGLGAGVLLSAIAARPGPPGPTAPAATSAVRSEQSLAAQLSAQWEQAPPAGWVLGGPDHPAAGQWRAPFGSAA